MIDYILNRSKRKTIAIHITKDATVEVRAPLKTPLSEINRFVVSKQDWINKHLSARKQSLQNKAIFVLNYGDTVTVRGKEIPITAKAGNRIGFDGECFYLPPGLSEDQIKSAVIQIYRLIAKKILTERAAVYTNATGIRPSAIKVNGAKTRWGSCSGKNSINFSWRLIMAEDDVIDYVVVHELAHIKEHNHSDRFWSIVFCILPDYRERQSRLKSLQKRLADENWE